MVCSEGSVGMPQNMMLVSMVHSRRDKQQDTRCTRVKVLEGGRLMTENQIWPSRKSLAVFMKNRLLQNGLDEITDSDWCKIKSNLLVKSLYQINRRSHLNLFKSVSVATGKTLSRVHSPTSTASQELHRKCHFWPFSRSCTITLLTYLHTTSVIIYRAHNIDTNSSLTCPVAYTKQGILLSCHATVWCSADLQEKNVWSAGTCPPLPSQTQASRDLSGGGVHFLPLYPSELSSPKTKKMRQHGWRFWELSECQHHKCCSAETSDRFCFSVSPSML